MIIILFEKKFFKFLPSPAKKTKSIISQKLKIAQKKSFMQKMSVTSILIYPANLSTFEGSWLFEHPKRRFWTPTAPKRNMIWYEILCPSLFLAHCASFMSDDNFWKGEGLQLCISVVGKQPLYLFFYFIIYWLIIVLYKNLLTWKQCFSLFIPNDKKDCFRGVSGGVLFWTPWCTNPM